MSEYLLTRGPYLLFVLLMALGCFLLLAHRNLLKAVIGLYIFQSGAILFFILLAARKDGTIPIVDQHINSALINPLPHTLMLTAIVVGVATLGVALAILLRIQKESGSIEDHWFEAKEG